MVVLLAIAGAVSAVGSREPPVTSGRRRCGFRMVRVAAVVRVDQRGIALQTTIIMTTLIAIALAVSAVLYTRGGEVADDLERQRLTRSPSDFSTQVLCEAYEFTWDGTTNTCS
ncbi:MAG: hypothetical protein OXH54_04070 [Acidimicrobiaceae bacterium]|nr:hypothetical protein [Acidimicrobiaceae bacterium]